MHMHLNSPFEFIMLFNKIIYSIILPRSDCHSQHQTKSEKENQMNSKVTIETYCSHLAQYGLSHSSNFDFRQ